MPAESEEPEKNKNSFVRPQIHPITDESTDFKEAAKNTKRFETQPKINPDLQATRKDLEALLPLGDTEKYQEHNARSSGVWTKNPLKKDSVGPLPDLVREKPVSRDDIANTFISEHVINPEQPAEDSRRIDPSDLRNAPQLIYSTPSKQKK